MGKLTYVAYLTHVAVIKLIYGRVREPLYLSVTKIVRQEFIKSFSKLLTSRLSRQFW